MIQTDFLTVLKDSDKSHALVLGDGDANLKKKYGLHVHKYGGNLRMPIAGASFIGHL